MFGVEGGRTFIGRHHDVGEFDLVSGSAPKETVHTFSGFKCENPTDGYGVVGELEGFFGEYLNSIDRASMLMERATGGVG